MRLGNVVYKCSFNELLLHRVNFAYPKPMTLTSHDCNVLRLLGTTSEKTYLSGHLLKDIK